jgi:hypothetical protein
MGSKLIARLRRLPYPYRALLAIATDLDGTRTAGEYFELLRFWNTADVTQLGNGLGLQLSNSIYFAMPQNEFSYWNASCESRQLLRDCNQEGLIDTLHSYGNLADDAKSISECIDEIEHHSMVFPVWSNHSYAPSNFQLRSNRVQAAGDKVGSATYHAERTLRNGVRYIVGSQVTAVLGQEIRPNPARGISSISGGRNVLFGQLAKIFCSRLMPRYRSHAGNRVLNPVQLADGQQSIEILRANWHQKGIATGCSGRVIHELLNPKFIRRLSAAGGVAMIYTHLGHCFRMRRTDLAAQVQALHLIKAELTKNLVLMMTTLDLLDYLLLVRYVNLRSSTESGCANVDVRTNAIPMRGHDVEATISRLGLTILVESKERPMLTVDGRVPSADVTYTRVRNSTWRLQFPMSRKTLPSSLLV